MKELLATYAASKVQDGQFLGLGSGTTAEAAIRKIAWRVNSEGLKVRAVATSFRTATLAIELGLTVLPLTASVVPNYAFDGADEVDSDLRMIKGGGAALTREKLVARRAGGLIVLITEEKLVTQLGEKFAVPVEVLIDAIPDVTKALRAAGAVEIKLREGSGKYGPVLTDLGNAVLDAKFKGALPADLERTLKLIPGVIESGIFSNDAKEVIVARDSRLYRVEAGGRFTLVEC